MGGTTDPSQRRAEIGRRAPQDRGRARRARAGLGRREAGPRPDPRVDAGRRPAVRRRLAHGVRQPGARSSPGLTPGSARPGLPSEPPRDDPARGRDRAHRGRGDRDGCAHPLAPGDGHAGGNGRLGPGRDRRRHGGATLGRRASRLRRERVARAEDPGGVHPGGSRDAPARVAGGPRGGAALRRAARTGSGASFQDRRRPLGSLASGVGQRAPGPRPSGRVGPRGELAVRGGGDRGGPDDRRRGRSRARGARFRARPVPTGPEPVGQRDPLHELCRHGGRVGDGRQRIGRPPRDRHRVRDPVEGASPRVRALLPRGPRAVARDRRHRVGARDRSARRREPRWHGDGGERARAEARRSRFDCRRRSPKGPSPADPEDAARRMLPGR